MLDGPIAFLYRTGRGRRQKRGSFVRYLNTIAIAALATAMSHSLATAQTAIVEAEDTRVFLEADTLTEDRKTNQLIAEGEVEVRYQGRTLRANRLVYDLETRKIRAQGDVQIFDADGTARFADEVEVDENLDDGYATNFSTRLPGNAVAIANTAVRDADGVNAFENVIYTSCEICADSEDAPTWALRARRAEQNPNTQMVSYTDAVLEVAGVPVLYFPYFTHPDPSSERRSGFLFPRFGASSTLGAYYQQPYLYVISPSSDITLSPQINSSVAPFFGYNYRKRFYSGEVEFDGSFAYDELFDSDGDTLFFDSTGAIVDDPSTFPGEVFKSEASLRSHLFARGLFDLNKDWQWGFGIERASDDEYTRRYDVQGEDLTRGLYEPQPRQLLSQLFLTGQDETFYADASVLSFQGLRSTDDAALLPTVAPLVYGERLWDLKDRGTVTLGFQGAMIERSEGDDQTRATGFLEWDHQAILPGGLVFEPFASARADVFDFKTVNANGSTRSDVSETRTAASAGAILKWPLARTGERVDILIEPTIMVAYTDASLDNSDILLEDGVFYELDDTALFEPNGYGGFDYLENGKRAAAGVTTRARVKGGPEFFATFGRRWRSDADPAFDIASNLDGTVSDYVLGGGIDFGERFDIQTSARFDDDFTLQRIDARTNFDVWRLKGSFRYFAIGEDIANDQQRPEREEGIQARAQFRLTDRWSATYQLLRDITENRDTYDSVGILYQDDCSFFAIEYASREVGLRRFRNSESIRFRIGLKTLGSFGDNDFD